MNAVTFNSSDQRALSMRELSETVLKFKAQHEPPLKAIKLSRATLLCFPPSPIQGITQQPISTFYGVPVEVDDSLGLFEFEKVY